MKTLVLNLIVMTFSISAQAGLMFNYAQLKVKDLDEVAKIVSRKVAEAGREKNDKTVPLKEAFQAVYSRPNEDFMIEKVIGPVKNALDEQDAYEQVVKDLVKEAVGALKNAKAFRPVIQATYLVFLENIIAEFQPRVGQAFEKSILEQIKKAEIEVTKQAKDERLTRVMKETISPSEQAAKILDAKAEADAKKP